ncbi:metallophosphoesterase family protein [Brevibacillus daliensis]|uniref:metallophosphoesterase family protein n=1 Tax=Brevibacillus daliensis TaxID=2892995 RepID=UPI001E5F8054|nr:metallophosphoesterase family protein [Brevibacillus daliensis]
MNQQIAVLSDIHGNIWALESVLHDCKKRGIKQLFNLGDSLMGSLSPLDTFERIRSEDMITISGNQDRLIIDRDSSGAISPTLSMVRSQLAVESFTWLENLPSTYVWNDEIFLCHGTPESDEAYLVDEFINNNIVPKPINLLVSQLTEFPYPVILFGHSHIPKKIVLPNGQLIVNPGSVGLPAYTDDLPVPHAMESMSPHAKYAILTNEDGQWQVEFIQIEYDWQHAASMALRNGRSDWNHWLLHGTA